MRSSFDPHSGIHDLNMVTSSEERWAGFTVEHFKCPPTSLFSQTVENHTLTFNLGPPLGFGWKSNEEWNQTICDTGCLPGLLPAFQREETQWHQEYHGLGITFDPLFVGRILEIDHFRFQEQRNLHDPFLKDVAYKLYDAANSSLFAEKVYAESLSVACVAHMARQYGGVNAEAFAPKGKLSPGQLKKVIDFAYSYMQLDIGLEELAALVHLSPYHFGRLFKQTVGLSPYQFLLQLKIEYSKKLIKQNNGPIGDIAYQLNFSDLAHFSNAFRKATGVSPRQFLASQGV